MAVIIDGRNGRMRATSCEQLEGARRISHPLVRIDLCVSRVSHCYQLKPVDIEDFFQLVGDAKFVASVARLKLIIANPHVLVGVRVIAHARRFPVAHLSAAHEVSHKLESLPVPGVQKRTR